MANTGSRSNKPLPAETALRNLLEQADIRINGERRWDIRVKHPGFYNRVLSGGSLALGESYVDGWWDCEALDQFFEKILACRLDKTAATGNRLALGLAFLRARLGNAQRKSRAHIIGERHYDLGNKLFSAMLDRGMNYSCAYWKQARTLDEAQEAKAEMIGRKIGLQPGMRLLDIGCGWGGFAKYAAEHFGASVRGITISREQVDFARNFCRGLDVEIEQQDYREETGRYDRIVSIGMFEHVGNKNYKTFMKVVDRCLEPDGLFLLHTIGGNTTTSVPDPWISTYIFPNSILPSPRQIVSAAEGLFVLEDWHSFGEQYDPTLMAWYENFTNHWDMLKETYDERFYRTWVYYLLSCAGSFRARRNQVWQIVFSKNGIKGGYPYSERSFPDGVASERPPHEPASLTNLRSES